MGKNPNFVLGNDQMGNRAVLYDLSLLQENDPLEKGEVWSFSCGHFAGIKYRENTPFGDVILTGGEMGYMVSYPSKEILWSTNQSGNNTHSAEILPSGNIVFANSHGNDLRLFRTSALLQGDEETAATYVSYPFGCAHGVLWDPVYECLWVIGEWDLAAYRVVGQGVDEALEPIEGKSWSLKPFSNGGHDLSPDLTDSRYLFLTPCLGVVRFDKETGTFSRPFPEDGRHFKAFTQAEDGSFVLSDPTKEHRRRSLDDWWKGDWCADSICTLTPGPDGSLVWHRYYAEIAAFYKCRAFCGRYL